MISLFFKLIQFAISIIAIVSVYSLKIGVIMAFWAIIDPDAMFFINNVIVPTFFK